MEMYFWRSRFPNTLSLRPGTQTTVQKMRVQFLLVIGSVYIFLLYLKKVVVFYYQVLLPKHVCLSHFISWSTNHFEASVCVVSYLMVSFPSRNYWLL